MRPRDVQMQGDRRPDDRPHTPRPRRTVGRGPIGFSQVMGLVRRDRGRGGPELASGEARELRRQAGLVDSEHSNADELRQLVHGARSDEERRRELEAAESEADAPNPLALATSVLALEAAHLAGGDTLPSIDAASAPGNSVPSAGPQQLGRMTPERALTAVLDEARKAEIAEACKELHIELDPVGLGPLLVRISVDQGRIRTELRAREAQAVARLQAGSNDLRERLARLGYAAADVTVEHDEELGG